MHSPRITLSFPLSVLTTIIVLVGAEHSVASARTLAVGGKTGLAGWVVSVPVTLSGSSGTAGTQNDISFDGVNLRIQAKADGTPDCSVNTSIAKDGRFGFLPFGCIGADCYSVRAVIFAQDNVNTISDATLYSCKVQIGLSTPPGTYALIISNPAAGSSTGQDQSVSGQSGSVTVTLSCGCGCP